MSEKITELIHKPTDLLQVADDELWFNPSCKKFIPVVYAIGKS